ncbi:MAG: hypothetical protein HYY80_01220 [Chloroflexi bacterium]|nr:hypothetical protein [Chloroflexota bacterium]
MAKCPNCGQETARTEDWACQWCGYPLLSRSYKQIAKTYKQLKEEELLRQRAPLGDETEPEPVTELEPAPEPELEPAPKPKPERKPRAKTRATTKPKPAPEAEPAAKLKPAPKPKPKPKPKPVTEAEPAAEPEATPTAVTRPEPVPGPEPVAATIELTVDELLSAYEVAGVAADARFTNKILKITGIANRVEVKDILDVYYINLTGAERHALQDVRCVFDRRYAAELNKLTTGQPVTVQGKYDGSIINISLRDCVLVQ